MNNLADPYFLRPLSKKGIRAAYCFSDLFYNIHTLIYEALQQLVL